MNQTGKIAGYFLPLKRFPHFVDNVGKGDNNDSIWIKDKKISGKAI